MIERSIREALHSSEPGSTQEGWTKALRAVLEAGKADGFQDVELSPEVQPEIKRFSFETREELRKKGYSIYLLKGDSILDARESGRKFVSDWHQKYHALESLPSRRSEVAINPKKLFIPKSNNKTLTQQIEMVADFSKKISIPIDEVEVIIGEAADYVELGLLYFDTNGEAWEYKSAITQTQTPSMDNGIVVVAHGTKGLCITHWDKEEGNENVYVAPLIFPK